MLAVPLRGPCHGSAVARVRGVRHTRVHRMIKYPDGTGANVGDNVSLSHDTDRGVVRHVLDTIELAESWNLDEIGLMIESTATGLTFYPIHSLDRDEIQFISRVLAYLPRRSRSRTNA